MACPWAAPAGAGPRLRAAGAGARHSLRGLRSGRQHSRGRAGGLQPTISSACTHVLLPLIGCSITSCTFIVRSTTAEA
jgi:hypothetical protein